MSMYSKTSTFNLTTEICYSGAADAMLLGDLYVPCTKETHPVIIAVHGGNWDQGSRSAYAPWGEFLAEHGYAVFAVDRRHFSPDEPAYPGVIHDLQAAVWYV